MIQILYFMSLFVTLTLKIKAYKNFSMIMYVSNNRKYLKKESFIKL